MDMDDYDRLARGLRRYLTLVAEAVGVGAESCCVHFGSTTDAYIALEDRLRAFPDRDAALLWDEWRGWALAVETHGGAEAMVLGHLGADVLPLPNVVADHVRRAVDGHSLGEPSPPRFRADHAADLLVRLADYAAPVGPAAGWTIQLPPGSADPVGRSARSR